jgi:hypothetical protein
MNQYYYDPYEEPTVWPYYFIGAVVIMIISCLLASTFQSVWRSISADLRTMAPEQSWLIIIPILGIIWMFYMIYQMGNALKEEFKRREIVEFESTPGLGIGWAFSFALLTGQLVSFIGEPVLTAILLITAVILLIIFWIRLAGFQRKLETLNGAGFHQFHHMPPPPQQEWPPNYPPPQNNQWPPQNNPWTPSNNQWPPQNFPPPPQQNEWEKWKPKQ